MNARVPDPAWPPVVALLPDDAPFSPDQRAWLNGFFAGLLTRLAAQAKASAAPAAPRLALHVAFASQTGTAEGLARKLNKEAKGKAFDARVQDLGTLSLDALAKLRHVVVIASTHGEGEPPDSVGAFVMQLDAAQGTPLQGVKYAVLALGDRNYARFCHFGKILDERFAALGATRLIDRIDADGDAAPAFRSFRERLWPTLLAEAPAQAASAAPQDEDDEADETEERWTRAGPFAAALLKKEILNGPDSDKEVRHVALSLAGSGLHYEPGDALGVWPRQSPALVDAVLAATGMAARSEVSVDGQAFELREALATRRELAKLSPATLIKLAKLTGDEALHRLVQPDHDGELQHYLYGRDVVDALAGHAKAVTEPQVLFDLLPPLAPRLYSIASSLEAFPGEVHLTVATVRYRSHGRERGGVASTWFADALAIGDAAPVYVHRNPRFRLPADAGVPLIMIGPGTGIAPFRAFLHHRRAHGLTGRTWLFFGDRRAQCDFLYRRELEDFLEHGTLSRLDTAFSRDQSQKVYVQHRMLEAGEAVWRWLQDGAHVYVCGDASRMAKDVDAALRTIIARHGHRSDAQATLELHTLAAEGRYVRDVY